MSSHTLLMHICTYMCVVYIVCTQTHAHSLIQSGVLARLFLKDMEPFLKRKVPFLNDKNIICPLLNSSIYIGTVLYIYSLAKRCYGFTLNLVITYTHVHVQWSEVLLHCLQNVYLIASLLSYSIIMYYLIT